MNPGARKRAAKAAAWVCAAAIVGGSVVWLFTWAMRLPAFVYGAILAATVAAAIGASFVICGGDEK